MMTPKVRRTRCVPCTTVCGPSSATVPGGTIGRSDSQPGKSSTDDFWRKTATNLSGDTQLDRGEQSFPSITRKRERIQWERSHPQPNPTRGGQPQPTIPTLLPTRLTTNWIAHEGTDWTAVKGRSEGSLIRKEKIHSILSQLNSVQFRCPSNKMLSQ